MTMCSTAMLFVKWTLVRATSSVSSSEVPGTDCPLKGEELSLMEVRGWSSDKETISSKAELGHEGELFSLIFTNS